MLLLLSNNINIQSPWMLSFEIFGSVCAAAADYRYIRYRPSIPAGASKDFINEYNNTSHSLQVHEKFRVWKKVFIYFIFYIYLKRMGLNLATNLPMFVYTFQAMWHHRPLKEYSVYVGIRAACTSISPYTLRVAYLLPCHSTNSARLCCVVLFLSYISSKMAEKPCESVHCAF